MRVVVFGGSGFLGSHVADALTDKRYEVIIYDKKKSPYLKEGQRFILGDILDEKKVEEAVVGSRIVYNFAAFSDIEEAKFKPLETITTNIIGNTNILEACRKNKIQRFVFASTLYVYSEAGSFYRSSKQACELIIENYHRQYGLDFTILRYGSLYGPRADEKNWVYRILKQALKENKITRRGDGNEIREYIYVYDAAKLSVKILDEEYKNQYVMITGNQQMRIKDLMLMIKEMLGNKIKLEFTKANYEEHYEITPYVFKPKLAKKIVGDSYIDLGQGILDLLDILHKEKFSQENKTQIKQG